MNWIDSFTSTSYSNLVYPLKLTFFQIDVVFINQIANLDHSQKILVLRNPGSGLAADRAGR